jgi:uncharacterized protein Usg
LFIIKKNDLITIDILYYIPHYSLVQEFIWQTEDILPEIPKVHKFLNYWKDNIDAIIKEVLISTEKNKYIRNINFIEMYKC